MPTDLLFRDDAYLRTATATVLAVSERGIELDRTLFYPQGGGQAGDSGTLRRASGECDGGRRYAQGRRARLHPAPAGAGKPRARARGERSRSSSTGRGAIA